MKTRASLPACPRCAGRLTYHNSGIVGCRGCDARYDVAESGDLALKSSPKPHKCPACEGRLSKTGSGTRGIYYRCDDCEARYLKPPGGPIGPYVPRPNGWQLHDADRERVQPARLRQGIIQPRRDGQDLREWMLESYLACRLAVELGRENV